MKKNYYLTVKNKKKLWRIDFMGDQLCCSYYVKVRNKQRNVVIIKTTYLATHEINLIFYYNYTIFPIENHSLFVSEKI